MRKIAIQRSRGRGGKRQAHRKHAKTGLPAGGPCVRVALTAVLSWEARHAGSAVLFPSWCTLLRTPLSFSESVRKFRTRFTATWLPRVIILVLPCWIPYDGKLGRANIAQCGLHYQHLLFLAFLRRRRQSAFITYARDSNSGEEGFVFVFSMLHSKIKIMIYRGLKFRRVGALFVFRLLKKNLHWR